MDENIKGILSVTLSKPCSAQKTEEALGRRYIKIKARANTASPIDDSRLFFIEKFTATAAFHEYVGQEGLSFFLDKCVGKVFLNCIIRTDNSEISYYTDKNGKIFRHCRATKPINADAYDGLSTANAANLFQKQHILREGTAVPFLVRLGIMTDKGKVVQSKYGKFKQINRFLEYVRDIINDHNFSSDANPHNILDARAESVASNGAAAFQGGDGRHICAVDFGCGKAYLTFAIHYYLTEILKIKAFVTGIDIKDSVINYCNDVAKDLRCEGLHFETGDIAGYKGEATDLVVALHACDTATDDALAFAVLSGARAILSAPCCQHEVNMQLEKKRKMFDANAYGGKEQNTSPFALLLKHGLLRERFAALATDALRAEYLEAAGYNVQLLEFVDAEHTPKNLLIRAIKRRGVNAEIESKKTKSALLEAKALTDALDVNIALGHLIN